MEESRTKPKHQRVENYDILTNGFFFFSFLLSFSSCAVSVSLFTSNLRCFQFFRLLFVPFEEAHIAPWRRILLLRRSLSLFCFHHLMKNSNGFLQLPKNEQNNKT